MPNIDKSAAAKMTIEIHRPELEALIMERMRSGKFHDVEDVLIAGLGDITGNGCKPPKQRLENARVPI